MFAHILGHRGQNTVPLPEFELVVELAAQRDNTPDVHRLRGIADRDDVSLGMGCVVFGTVDGRYDEEIVRGRGDHSLIIVAVFVAHQIQGFPGLRVLGIIQAESIDFEPGTVTPGLVGLLVLLVNPGHGVEGLTDQAALDEGARRLRIGR